MISLIEVSTENLHILNIVKIKCDSFTSQFSDIFYHMRPIISKMPKTLVRRSVSDKLLFYCKYAETIYIYI